MTKPVELDARHPLPCLVLSSGLGQSLECRRSSPLGWEELICPHAKCRISMEELGGLWAIPPGQRRRRPLAPPAASPPLRWQPSPRALVARHWDRVARPVHGMPRHVVKSPASETSKTEGDTIQVEVALMCGGGGTGPSPPPLCVPPKQQGNEHRVMGPVLGAQSTPGNTSAPSGTAFPEVFPYFFKPDT